jgi:hypothetical protein
VFGQISAISSEASRLTLAASIASAIERPRDQEAVAGLVDSARNALPAEDRVESAGLEARAAFSPPCQGGARCRRRFRHDDRAEMAHAANR